MLLWERYCFKEWIKVFGLFIFCFYFLYVLVDISAHTKIFQQEGIHFTHIISYYFMQFSKLAEILIPFGFLISFIKVVLSMNVRNETVALLVGGIPVKRLLRPFFIAALLCMSALYLNFQFFYPLSSDRLNQFEERFFKDQSKEKKNPKVSQIFLKDGSVFIYRQYEPSIKAFYDVYWIRSFQDLYRIQWVFPYEKVPVGMAIDHLVRSPSDELHRVASFDSYAFPEMTFEGNTLYEASHPAKEQSLLHLFRTLCTKEKNKNKLSDKEGQIATQFFYKALLPSVCLLALFAPASFLFRFSRSVPVFMIYTISLFGLIAFFTLVNASVILAESQILPPGVVLLAPFGLAFLVCSVRYAKL